MLFMSMGTKIGEIVSIFLERVLATRHGEEKQQRTSLMCFNLGKTSYDYCE